MRRLLPLVFLTGCATLLAGGPDQIPVATNPPGAYVYVNGRFIGQTPTLIALDRGSNGLIQIYLPGFQPILRRSLRPMPWARAALFAVRG